MKKLIFVLFSVFQLFSFAVGVSAGFESHSNESGGYVEIIPFSNDDPEYEED